MSDTKKLETLRSQVTTLVKESGIPEIKIEIKSSVGNFSVYKSPLPQKP